MSLPDLSGTRDAITAYDEVMSGFDAERVSHMKPKEAGAVYDEIERLRIAVGVAFGEDTKDRNDPDTCRDLVRPGPLVPGPGCEESFVRRMVRQWEESDCA